MREESHLRKTAHTIQKIHCQLLRSSSYDVIPHDKLEKFEVILGHYFQEETAKKLSSKIISRGSNLYFRILLVNCLSDDGIITVPVIRVLENNRSVFYDIHYRKYSDWNDFLCSNKFPECLMLYPENGIYSMKNGEVKIGTEKSPALHIGTKVDMHLYKLAEIVSAATTILPMFSFAKPYATHIKWGSGLSNAYRFGHHGHKLYDRYKHDEEITDEAASIHWFHIGNAFVSFAVCCLRVEYVQPTKYNDMDNLMKLLTLCQKKFSTQNSSSALNVIRGHLLCQHMLDLSNEAASSYQHLLSSDINIGKLILGLLSNLKSGESAVRRLIYVDDNSLKKVAQDIKNCNDVSGGMKTGIYELLQDKVNIVEKIMNEVISWKHQKISDEQLRFRITEICKNGDKMYETMSEMCLSFKVGSMESIKVNGKLIFQNVGAEKSALETLVNHASKKFPQLLTYAVEYASSQNGNIDWDGFKPYFKKRIFEEKCSDFNVNDARPDISWINANDYEEVIFSSKALENQIDLFRHNNVKPVSICTQDLVNLGKKILGSIRVDVTIAKPATNCVVVISKMKKLVVLIAPEVNIGNCPFNGSYPVFIRAF